MTPWRLAVPRLSGMAIVAWLAVACAQSESGGVKTATPQGSCVSAATPQGSCVSAATPQGSGDIDLPPGAPAGTSIAPLVDLGGVTQMPPGLPPSAPRVAARRWVVPVLARPDAKARRLGSLRAGATVQSFGDAVPGPGCRDGWQRIAPLGFVCLGKGATRDLTDPIVRATTRRPDFAHRLPYMYGTVRWPGPVYSRVPSAAQLRKYEPRLAKHLRRWERDEISGAGYGLDVWLRHTKRRKVATALEALTAKLTDPDIPWFLKDGAQAPDLYGKIDSPEDTKIGFVKRRQGRSFTHSFLFEGRRYNVTPDLAVIPADRFRPIRGSAFTGWRVGIDVNFPFALVRRTGARKWIWSATKKRMIDHEALAWRSAVQLTGKQRFYKKRLYYQTVSGDYVDDRHAGRVDPAKRWPKWAKQGAKWIDINLTKQVLVAYEGTRAVFATLISSGEAGLGDPDKSTATKRGIFRIHTKWVSSTMDSDVVGEAFELRDVPYVQYFEGGYALHGAYWHDGFGRPKSHGCINLSPEDARRLFFWTEPQVPPGWHEARKSLRGTIVFVHP
jgi:hypothetical protein